MPRAPRPLVPSCAHSTVRVRLPNETVSQSRRGGLRQQGHGARGTSLTLFGEGGYLWVRCAGVRFNRRELPCGGSVLFPSCRAQGAAGGTAPTVSKALGATPSTGELARFRGHIPVVSVGGRLGRGRTPARGILHRFSQPQRGDCHPTQVKGVWLRGH